MKKKLSKPRKVNNHLWKYEEEDYVIQRTWSLLPGENDKLFFIYDSFENCEKGMHINTATDFYGAKRILTHLLNGDDEARLQEIQHQKDLFNQMHEESRERYRKEREAKEINRSWRRQK